MANASKKGTLKKYRDMGKEGMGGGGDLNDRFRGTYKPGANPAPKPGLRNPVDVVKGLLKRKPKAKP